MVTCTSLGHAAVSTVDMSIASSSCGLELVLLGSKHESALSVLVTFMIVATCSRTPVRH